MASATPSFGSVSGSFLYTLSDFNGPVAEDWATIFIDPTRQEVYTAGFGTGLVRVFNDRGMEIFSFGNYQTFGAILGGAVNPAGDIFLLTVRNGEPSIVRCNFRGEIAETVEVQGLPDDYADMRMDALGYYGGSLYIADKPALRVVLTDEKGQFQRAIDLAPRLDIAESERFDSGLSGFSVDSEGSILFTVPANFAGYKLYANGRLSAFGRPGSGPGKFGVAGGIVSDGHGNILVSDILRCVVMIYDEDLKFQSEFGYRGLFPGSLIAPFSLGFDRNKVFVSQRAHRGISVFDLSYEQQRPDTPDTEKN